jgi:hypothetical protein
MTTRIVFGGGAHIEVPLRVEQVKDALDQDADGRGLSELDLTEADDSGNPRRIYLNRDQVAYIIDAETSERPVQEPPSVEFPDEGSPEPADAAAEQVDKKRKPVTDLWGNPIRPRRRHR